MKGISLTAGQQQLVENILAEYGHLVTFEQISTLLKGHAPASIRKQLSVLGQKGWLFRIKRGLYAVCDISSRGTLPISEMAVPNLLVQDSYVSFEGALQYHGRYDQQLGVIRSVAIKQHITTEVGGVQYQFIRTQERYFYGWQEVWLSGVSTRIADSEKSLIDLLQFRRSRHRVDLIIEILEESGHQVDWGRLGEYLARAPLTVQRIFGFVFDLLGRQVEAESLHGLTKGNTSHSKIAPTSDVFSSRWRLYYDQYFEKYLSS
jgi:predicted transcriptional regulator of viral defense system